MIRECFKADTGIMFYAKGLREIGLDPSTLYPFVTPRPPPIAVGDAVFEEPPRSPPSWIQRSFSRLKRKLLPRSVQDIGSPPVNPTKATETVRVGTEEEEDLKDALSPIYDQLKLRHAWWILEILPLKLRYQRGDSSWVSYVGYVPPDFQPPVYLMHTTSCNMGSSRFIPAQHDCGIKFHRTVKTRMDAGCPPSCRKYSPHPSIRTDPTWVD
jgi:hypothetical protein